MAFLLLLLLLLREENEIFRGSRLRTRGNDRWLKPPFLISPLQLKCDTTSLLIRRRLLPHIKFSRKRHFHVWQNNKGQMGEGESASLMILTFSFLFAFGVQSLDAHLLLLSGLNVIKENRSRIIKSHSFCCFSAQRLLERFSQHANNLLIRSVRSVNQWLGSGCEWRCSVPFWTCRDT